MNTKAIARRVPKDMFGPAEWHKAPDKRIPPPAGTSPVSDRQAIPLWEVGQAAGDVRVAQPGAAAATSGCLESHQYNDVVPQRWAPMMMKSGYEPGAAPILPMTLRARVNGVKTGSEHSRRDRRCSAPRQHRDRSSRRRRDP